MITQIIWIAFLPVLIYVAYKIIVITYNYFEKNQL
jgi:hypothetical protein